MIFLVHFYVGQKGFSRSYDKGFQRSSYVGYVLTR